MLAMGEAFSFILYENRLGLLKLVLKMVNVLKKASIKKAG
uniref:Uncharacterized protein n=1 Tax=Anguilla anguilla TaxID=7936 RepID=A0A0E9R1H4_ANGAN